MTRERPGWSSALVWAAAKFVAPHQSGASVLLQGNADASVPGSYRHGEESWDEWLDIWLPVVGMLLVYVTLSY